MRSTLVITFLLAVIGLAQAALAVDRSYVDPSLPEEAGLPFSGAVQVGDTLYLSGDIGLDENGQVPDDPSEEARLLMEAFKARLAKAGFSMDDLVTVTVYCSDVAHYDAWNAVYRSYFKETFPARAFIGSGTLLFDARFEMQAIAVKR